MKLLFKLLMIMGLYYTFFHVKESKFQEYSIPTS